jgi:hypothetical protein
MKLASLICATLVIGAGCVCTAAGAQALDEAECQVAWSIASPHGATLSKDEAVPLYVLEENFTEVDTNNDAAVDVNEFKTACLGGDTRFWANVPGAISPFAGGCKKGSCKSDGIAYCCL